jgi:hypothetical protein
VSSSVNRALSGGPPAGPTAATSKLRPGIPGPTKLLGLVLGTREFPSKKLPPLAKRTDPTARPESHDDNRFPFNDIDNRKNG